MHKFWQQSFLKGFKIKRSNLSQQKSTKLYLEIYQAYEILNSTFVKIKAQGIVDIGLDNSVVKERLRQAIL